MKKNLALFFLILGLPLLGVADEYTDLLKAHPELIVPKGDHKLGEIEVVTDPDKIKEIQQKRYEKLREIGVPADRASKWTKVGEIARDSYSMWVRDAVIFPSGAYGLYNRFIGEGALQGHIGAAVLPIFSNGDIALVLQFRHATRSWELELPRGGGLQGETGLDSAKRELQEETGLTAQKWHFLGAMAPDTGSLQSQVPIFSATEIECGQSALEEGEAIDGTLRIPLAQLNQALKDGFVELQIKGVKRKVFVRDSFLTYALYLHSIQ